MTLFEDKKLNELMRLSEQICNEEGALAELSRRDLENTDSFMEHIKKLTSFLDKENKIISSLSIEKLNQYEQIMHANDKCDDKPIPFNRLFQLLQDKIEEYECSNPFDINIENTTSDEVTYIGNPNTEDIDDDYAEEANEDNSDELDDIQKSIEALSEYYEETYQLDKYIPYIFDNVAITIAHKIYRRIQDTTAQNKSETNYRNKLLNYLKQFKYYIFSLDYRLERIGVNYHFNIDAIPNFPELSIDLKPLYHNQSINVLYNLYSSSISSKSDNEILILLFDLMCLEEYIKYLDISHLNKLLEFCEKKEEISSTPNLGSSGKAKIKERLKTINN